MNQTKHTIQLRLPVECPSVHAKILNTQETPSPWWGTIISFAVIACLAIPATERLRQDGFPTTHDGILHLIRAILLNEYFREGIFYPRWLSELYLGFGYPVFNYYAPLFYYVVEFLHWLGASLPQPHDLHKQPPHHNPVQPTRATAATRKPETTAEAHIYHVFEGPKPPRDAPLPKTGGRTVYRYDVIDTKVAKQLWGRFLRDEQSDDTTTYIDQLVSRYD